MMEIIASTIIMYYMIGIPLSYFLLYRIVKIKEIETGMKIILFLTIPFIFIIRGVLEYFAGDTAKIILDIILFAFWIIMLDALIRRTKGMDRITMTFFLALTGTFGAMLILSTIKQKKTKILKDKFVMYTKDTLGKAADTFRQTDMRYVLTLLLDLLFYAAFAAIFISAIFIVNKLSSGIQAPQISAEMMTSQQIQDYSNMIYDLLFKMLALFITSLIFTALFMAVLKGLIWKIVMKAKIGLIHLLKLFAMNMMLAAAMLLIFYLMSLLSMQGPAFAALTLIVLILLFSYSIHYATILCYTFMQEKKIFASLGKSFMKSIKLHKFIIPYLIFLIMMIIINLVISIFSFAGDTAILIISVIFMLLSITWFRFYMAKVLEDV